jgi:hypothetical protein
VKSVCSKLAFLLAWVQADWGPSGFGWGLFLRGGREGGVENAAERLSLVGCSGGLRPGWGWRLSRTHQAALAFCSTDLEVHRTGTNWLVIWPGANSMHSCSCSVAPATVLVLVLETAPPGRANLSPSQRWSTPSISMTSTASLSANPGDLRPGWAGVFRGRIRLRWRSARRTWKSIVRARIGSSFGLAPTRCTRARAPSRQRRCSYSCSKPPHLAAQTFHQASDGAPRPSR